MVARPRQRGQVKGAEPTYRLTRGMNEAFLEKSVGEQLTSPPAPPLPGEGSGVRSAAGVLEAATLQGIPLMYVDAQRLELLADAPISKQAKARITQATQQGYGVLVPEQMVTWNRQQTIAWWQLDPKTGEVVDVNEDGTHQFMIEATKAIPLMLLPVSILGRYAMWRWAAGRTWTRFWETVEELREQYGDVGTEVLYRESLSRTKHYMQEQSLKVPSFFR